MNEKLDIGKILVIFVMLFALLAIFGLMLSCNTTVIEGYSEKQWNENNRQWQDKFDSVFSITDSIIPVYDTIEVIDTTEIIITDTSLYWKRYIGGVQFEQVGYYYHDSAQHVYFKVRNFDTLFHDSIYVDIYQGGQRKLRNEFAREGMTAGETFYRKYTSKFATDTSDYMFVLHDHGQPIDTAIIGYNNEKVFLHLVDSINYIGLK